MKRQVRYGVWETNSSSVNTLTIMTEDEYKEYMRKWYSDDWMWDGYKSEWVRTEDIKDGFKYRYSDNPCDGCSLEKEVEAYTTEHGDKVVAVSIYGQDC